MKSKSQITIQLITVTILLLTGAGCAIGPITASETARTVGEGRNEFSGAFGHTGPAFKWTYGFSENVDLGLQLEALSQGAKIKYAYINNQSRGWSVSNSVGLGISFFGSNYKYLDTAVGYLYNKIEPYVMVRIVQGRLNSSAINKAVSNFGFEINTRHYFYGQAFLGTRYWATDKFFISLEVSDAFTISKSLHLSTGPLVSGALGFRF